MADEEAMERTGEGETGEVTARSDAEMAEATEETAEDTTAGATVVIEACASACAGDAADAAFPSAIAGASASDGIVGDDRGAEVDRVDSPPPAALGREEELFEDLPERPVSMVDRAYTHYYAIDVDGTPFHDHYVYRHPNGLCIIGIAPSHFVLREEGKKIRAIDFNVGKSNRQDVQPTGKGKKNAHLLMPNSGLCKLLSSDDTSKTVRCCIRGSLLEVNSRLAKEPNLIMTKAHSEGYVAILMPRGYNWDKVGKELLTKEQYIEKRGDLACLR